METRIAEFENYLEKEKKMAVNSLKAYGRDVRDFAKFLMEKGFDDFGDAGNAAVVSYILYLGKSGLSSSTVNRKTAAVRTLYRFLVKRGYAEENPAEDIRTPKIEKKSVEYLSIEETERLLEQPDDSVKGRRDRAMLELMYATGMKVSEIVEADLDDINLKMGFIACGDDDKNMRIIPMGSLCREAMRIYLENSREELAADSEQKAIFVNVNGERLTRQGVWKIIRGYAAKAGIEKKITPQVLRHSFAIHMIQNGADVKSLQEMLGHADAATTQMYLRAAGNDIKSVYEKSHPRA